VLCDKYLADNSQRQGVLKVDRPMVLADVQNLPFRDNAFDYVICCHLLDHVEDPEQAVREITRVAPRGYIETPSEFAEKMVGKTCHKWFVSLQNGVLWFREKETYPFDSVLANTTHRLHMQRDRYWNYFYHGRFDLFLTCLEWNHHVTTSIERASTPCPVPEAESSSGSQPAQNFGPLKRLLYRTLTRRLVAPDLPDLLQSPCCRARVHVVDGVYACIECGRSFGEADGLPCFM
jgi:SAM-dependent methyltransferase